MLTYKATIHVKKDVPDKEEKYSQEEINLIAAHLNLPMSFDIGTRDVYRSEWNVEFVGPVRQMNDIKIPLADLRAEIVELMKAGVTEAPLEDFLLMLRHVYHNDES